MKWIIIGCSAMWMILAILEAFGLDFVPRSNFVEEFSLSVIFLVLYNVEVAIDGINRLVDGFKSILVIQKSLNEQQRAHNRILGELRDEQKKAQEHSYEE